MAEEDTSLANAIVDLFKNFYTVYLTDFNWKKHGYSPFPGTIINYENGMGEICDYYNNIAGVLDKTNYSNTELKAYPIKLQGDGIKEFQNELNVLSSDDLRLFLGNLLDFIKAYKLYALKNILKYIEDIGNAFKKIEEKFNNAEKYLADLIIAVGKGKDSIVTKLEELKSDYEKGTFFKNEKGLNLIVKTVKELGITEEYGKSMKKIDIGLYYKKMSFNNPVLICKMFSNWDKLKDLDEKDLYALKSMNGMDEKDFEQLKAIYYMERPHAHHALYKNWHEMVEEAQDILWEYDIDPFVGLENLCWAPNIKGQHSTKHVKEIIDGLKELKKERATRNDIVSFLLEQKKISSEYVKK